MAFAVSFGHCDSNGFFDSFISRIAENRLCSPIPENNFSAAVNDYNGITRGLHHGAEALFSIAQHLLRLLPFAYIQTVFYYLSNVPFIVKDGITVDFNISHFPIFVVMNMLNSQRSLCPLYLLNRTWMFHISTRFITIMGKGVTGYTSQ